MHVIGGFGFLFLRAELNDIDIKGRMMTMSKKGFVLVGDWRLMRCCLLAEIGWNQNASPSGAL